MPTMTAAALACLSGFALAGPGWTAQSATGPEPRQSQPAGDDELAPRTGLPAGTQAPDAALVNDEGEDVRLADLLDEAEGPVVLVFYRGGWCPYCTKHLAELQDALPELQELDATLLAVSPESYDKIAVSEEKSGAEFTILSDAKNEAAEAYNLIFEVDPRTEERYRGYGIVLEDWNADETWRLPVPAVYVIDTDGVIRFRHVDEDYRKRLSAKKLVSAVREVTGG